eukprot:4736502-Pyramimonas_sp.AAC.1
MAIGRPSQLKYRDDTHVPCAEKAKYLGCSQDSNMMSGRKCARIRNCYQTMQRLDAFWLHSDCTAS